MDDVHRPVRHGEHAEDERDGGAKPGTQPRERDDRPDPHRERDNGCERVLVEVDAWLPVEERVVERVDEREQGRGSEDERPPAPTRAPRRRRPLVQKRVDHGMQPFYTEGVGFIPRYLVPMARSPSEITRKEQRHPDRPTVPA